MDDVLELVMTVATRTSHIQQCTLWLHDPGSRPETFSFRACRGIDPDSIRSRTLEPPQGVVGLVATLKHSMTVYDLTCCPNFMEPSMAEEHGLASMIGIPLMNQAGDCTGVLNGFTTTPHHFTDAETTLFESVARQAAKAIENTESMVKKVLAREELMFWNTVEQATQVLMQRRGLDTHAATSLIHQWSHDACVPPHQIAEAILLAD